MLRRSVRSTKGQPSARYITSTSTPNRRRKKNVSKPAPKLDDADRTILAMQADDVEHDDLLHHQQNATEPTGNVNSPFPRSDTPFRSAPQPQPTIDPMQQIMQLLQQQGSANAALIDMIEHDRAAAAQTREAVAKIEERLRELTLPSTRSVDSTNTRLGSVVATIPAPSALNHDGLSPSMIPNNDEEIASSEPSNARDLQLLREYEREPRRNLLDLPMFTGRAEEWPMFIETFRSTTAAYGYSNLENNIRLQKCLSPEVKQTVECLLIHSYNVDRVIETLQRKYGRPGMLIRSQIQNVRELPPLQEANLEHLETFATQVLNLATFLDTKETQPHLTNPILIDELVSKLPHSSKMEWARVVSQLKRHPTVKDFAEWITEVADVASFVSTPSILHQPHVPTRGATSSFQRNMPRGKHVLLNSTSSKQNTRSCAICSQQHCMAECPSFHSLTPFDRWNQTKRLRLCFSCLFPGHQTESCHNRRQCNINGCTKTHHPMLHEHQYEWPNEPTNPVIVTNPHPLDRGNAADKPPFANRVLSCREVGDVPLLFRIVPVTLYGPERELNTFALLDEGSSLTLIDADTANLLDLSGPESNINMQWFGNQSTKQTSRKVSIGIKGTSPQDQRYTLDNVQTVRNIQLPTQTVQLSSLHSRYHHMRRLPIAGYENAVPKILIGLDHHHLGVPLSTCSRSERGHTAVKTKLGWVVFGRDDNNVQTGSHILHCDTDTRLELLECTVKQFFESENMGVTKPTHDLESDEDAHARRILEATTKRVGDRYQTGLLWRANTGPLPDSYQMALRRLIIVEGKMRREPIYAARYDQQIQDYVAKGYARQLTETEASQRDERTWYLPHFGVQNPNKPDKLRLVFDAAAKAKGISLNMKLLKGPDDNQPLLRILFRFRVGRVGVCADVKEMFHQIQIQPSDQNAQRFLWRHGNTNIHPKTFVMQVMTFGATCSPSAAQFIKNLNASAFEDKYPVAALAVKTLHYVDDYVASFQNSAEAIHTTKEVVQIHKSGGFELRGFVSNRPEVLIALGAEPIHGKPIALQLDASEKILGMSWDTRSDEFIFNLNFVRVDPLIVTGERKPTKRDILSALMSIFDPFGLLANFMLVAKIIIQDLWKLEVGWDDSIPHDIHSRWEAWRIEIENIRKLRVPRCYSVFIQTSQEIELHVFADASESASAAVAYWRIKGDEVWDVSFIVGKTKCAPRKTLSIPRLELQAAVLATRLLNTIVESHNINITKITMWTDSQTVIQWIRSTQRRYKPYVAHRISEILDGVAVSSWKWVPTAANAADDGTRIKFPIKFNPESRWLRGPEFLKLNECDWPIPEPPSNDDQIEDHLEEIRDRFVGLTTYTSIIKYERFSKFMRLCRTMAWLKRFVYNVTSARRGQQRASGELIQSEIEAATNILIRLVQKEGFPTEYETLLANQHLSRASSIFRLMPYMDENNIIRLWGRADAASDLYLTLEAKRRILLPRRHRFTDLLVQHHHEALGHQLENATITSVQQRFWVPQLRTMTRTTHNKCQLCRIRSAKPRPPPMGQLPVERLTPYVRPFTYTGLDFFGPVIVSIGRRHEKRWVALFTCLTIRAVHLEIAADLSTDACIICIRNFCNLRGIPKQIRSDNGTNFVGANNEIRRLADFLDHDEILRETATRGIEWIFNCPGNPEAGGAWERLVQSTKRVLAITLKESAPRVETLRSLLLEAANILNSRPLTHVPVDPSELDPLTPNHFLVGFSNSTTATGPGEICSRKQWRICQQLVHCFWSRWVRDYLPELTRRSKHFGEVPPLKAGDLVIICDSNISRNQWKRGRVEKIMTGTDGRVRVADVLTTDGVLRRPATKLAVLDVDNGLASTDSANGARDVAT